MFETNSRYAPLPEREYRDGNGRTVCYKSRRFLPRRPPLTTALQHQLSAGERLDNITARYYGKGQYGWRICDANLIDNPNELSDAVGEWIAVINPVGL